MINHLAIGVFIVMVVLDPCTRLAQADQETASSRGLLPYGFSVSATGTTDYVFLGLSNTSDKPAAQMSVDWVHESGFYAQIWGSNVDFGIPGEGDWEVDYSLGYAGALEAFDYAVTLTYFSFPGSDDDLGFDFFGVSLNAGYSLNPIYLFTEFNYTPDYFLNTGDGFNLEGGVRVPIPLNDLPVNWTVDATMARFWVADNAALTIPDYYHWNFGTTAEFKNIKADLRYYNTDVPRCDFCDERLVFSLSVTF